jgi:tRNA (guanine-N7-)-methyltransferase
LLHTAQMVAKKVYLLYPNPSPKPEHLKRRWHAHPIFPTLLACAETLELRTNWAIYAQEFALALQSCGWRAVQEPLPLAQALSAPISNFEAKYAASGHALWRVLGGRQ